VKVEPLSVTYARSLMELAQEKDKLRPVLEEVRAFAKLLAEDRELRVFLEVPSIPARKKIEVLERSLRGKMDDTVLDFIELVVEKGRQALLPEVFAECEVLYDEAVGRFHLEVSSVIPLGEDMTRKIEETMKGRVGREAVVVNRVQPEILGGLVFRYKDLVADDSVRTALEKIAQNMLSHKLGSELIHENQS